MNKGKVLVTGATGHVGPFVIEELLENDYQVRALVLDHEFFDPPGLKQFKSDIEISTGDVCNKDSLRWAFKDVDFGINMAALIGIFGYKKEIQRMQEINYQGTLNFLEAAKHHKISNTICFGSIEAMNEPELWHPSQMYEEVFDVDTWKTAYGSIKAEAIKDALTKYDTKILIPPGIIGPNDHRPSHIGRQLQKAMFGRGPIFYTKGSLMWAHPKDVARATIKVLEHGENNRYYFVDGFEASIEDIFREAAKYRKNKTPLIKVPSSIAWSVSMANYVACNLANQNLFKLPFTPLSQYILGNYRGISNALIENSRNLGYTPTYTNLEEVMKETAEYFMQK